MSSKKKKGSTLTSGALLAAETEIKPRARGVERRFTGTSEPSEKRGPMGYVRVPSGEILEIDTKYILPWGPKDRLGIDITSDVSLGVHESLQELVDDIKKNGQGVPVLLRPAGEPEGHFEVIYGRRRIIACKHLGFKVRALIAPKMSDKDAIKLKSQENTHRSGLSFYERARFAKEILREFDNDEAFVEEVLGIIPATRSQLNRIATNVPDKVGDAIGPAPNSGRPKWNKLADAFSTGGLTEEHALKILSSQKAIKSDELLDALLASLSKKETPEKREPVSGVKVKSTGTNVSITVSKRGNSAEFGAWLDEHLDQLMKESYAKFQQENSDEGAQ